MRGIGRVVALSLALLVLVVAVGCGARQNRRSAGAHIVVTLGPDGGGQVDVWTGRDLRTDAELRALGERVAAGVFPGGRVSRTVVRKGAAYPYARSWVAGAYRPGRRPTYRVADAGYGQALAAVGFPRYTLTVRLPHVVSSLGDRTDPPGAEYRWTVTPGAPSPSALIALRPQPLGWLVEMALLAVGVLGVAVAFLARRTVAVLGCAAALVAAGCVLATGGADRGEALGVLGYLSGVPLRLAILAPLATLPLAVTAAVRLLHLRASLPVR